MIPIIETNIPLRLLRNETCASMLSEKEVLGLQWDLKELQEFFFYYAQNTEASNLKARTLFQEKLDLQLSCHYEAHPIIADFVDPDEEYGTYSLDAIHTSKEVQSEVSETIKKKQSRSSRRSRQTKAHKKGILLSLDKTVPAFDSSSYVKSVSAAEKLTSVEQAPITHNPADPVDFEIGLTESRVPKNTCSVQIFNPSVLAVLKNSKPAFIGPMPFQLPHTLFKKHELESAFWYNLSMAQKIERPLGFELVYTGLIASASIDRSSNKFETVLPLITGPQVSLVNDCMESYKAVFKSIGLGESSDNGPEQSPTKKAKRQRRRRTRYRKGRKAKKGARLEEVKSGSSIETSIELSTGNEPKELANSPQFEVPVPEISDETDSDKDTIEVDSLPVYIEKSKKETSNKLQVGQLSPYHVFMKLLEEVKHAEVIPDETPETLRLHLSNLRPSFFHTYFQILSISNKCSGQAKPCMAATQPEVNNSQVGQLSQYHKFMKLVRDAEQAEVQQRCRLILENITFILEKKQSTEVSSKENEVNNLQVGQLSHYHHFMRLLRLNEYYHSYYKHLPQVRRAIKSYHTPPKATTVVLPGVSIVINMPESKQEISKLRIEDVKQNTADTSKQDSQTEDSSEASGLSESNPTSDSSIPSSPEPKQESLIYTKKQNVGKTNASKKPSFRKRAKNDSETPKVVSNYLGRLTSTARARRERKKRAQRNREFGQNNSDVPPL